MLKNASKSNFELLSSYIPTTIPTNRTPNFYYIFLNTTTDYNVFNNGLNYIPLTAPNDAYDTRKEFKNNFTRKIDNVLRRADISENVISKHNERTSSLYNMFVDYQHNKYEANKKILKSILNII
ncbi:hypothetical protein BB561_006968 [Smittium simulii]|uniref:Uncharacterized protein n=1 Tax=Smittium simulii TaxID=133385 RepID=A0A2T9XYV7_9FUNG|nr:hypothetical protein BB561_006968 [Smittium simulii]